MNLLHDAPKWWLVVGCVMFGLWFLLSGAPALGLALLVLGAVVVRWIRRTQARREAEARERPPA